MLSHTSFQWSSRPAATTSAPGELGPCGIWGARRPCPNHGGLPTEVFLSSLQTGVGTPSECHGELRQCHPCRGTLGPQGSLSTLRSGLRGQRQLLSVALPGIWAGTSAEGGLGAQSVFLGAVPPDPARHPPQTAGTAGARPEVFASRHPGPCRVGTGRGRDFSF